MVFLNTEINSSFLFLGFIFVFAFFLFTCLFLHLYHVRNEAFKDIAKQLEKSNEIETKKSDILLTYTTKEF